MGVALARVMLPRRPRLKDFSYTGRHRYFLTFCTIDRQTTFEDGEAVTLVLAQFRRTTGAWSFAILAYCFMPDHVHLLAQGTREDSDLKVFLKLAKQYSDDTSKDNGGEVGWASAMPPDPPVGKKAKPDPAAANVYCCAAL